MSNPAITPPAGFSWLRPADRPSDQEIDAYAHIIAHIEGFPVDRNADRLYREAELQLWAWHAALPARPPARRRRTLAKRCA